MSVFVLVLLLSSFMSLTFALFSIIDICKLLCVYMYVKGVILNEDLMMMMTNCEIDTTWMKVQGKNIGVCSIVDTSRLSLVHHQKENIYFEEINRKIESYLGKV